MAKRPGRRTAKNEVATALIAALKFGSVLKTPTTTSIEQAHYAWITNGTACMFDGIVAAGHPAPPDINAYPDTKLMLEALDNTDKSFAMTVHDNGNVEVTSSNYQALVPALAYNRVIPTMPDRQQVQINQPDAMLEAFKTMLKVTTEAGDTVLYSSVRATGNSLMGTNGAVMVEVLEPNNMPPVILPRQFIAAVDKAGLKPVGMGIGVDWETFTIWFENGAWLRTNVYKPEAWPTDAVELFYEAVNSQQNNSVAAIDPKLWAAVGAVTAFTNEDDGRVILRPGLVRTHQSRHEGAALEVKECNLTFDVAAKQFMALAEIATGFNTVHETLLFISGNNSRGIVAGLQLTPDETQAAATSGGWGSEVQNTQAPSPQAAGGWGAGGAMAQNIAPPPDERPAGDLNPEGKWKGGPEEGTAESAEYLAQYYDVPDDNFTDYDTLIISLPDDMGIPLNPQNTATDTGVNISGWAANLTDQDGGFNS